ncbi:MAG: Capsular polysaccharide export system protein KpsS [Caulobacteraceae bacterium]|nr:Capsular polysaccharide export system protein KpsS [Caulobacteraceae bacterium]
MAEFRQPALALSPQLKRLKALDAYFPEFPSVARRGSRRWRPSAVITHLADPDAGRGEILAARLGCKWLHMADGPLRSIGEPGSGAPPASLLEIAALAACQADPRLDTPALLDEARALLAFKQRHGLGYTHSAPAVNLGASNRSSILVMGGPATDAWAGDGADYGAMLAAARADHPAAQLIVIRPPGRHCLNDKDLRQADLVLETADLVQMARAVEAVYVVGGLAGLEGIWADKTVHCFGRTSYAGLGLTRDRASATTVKAALSPEQLFAATYILAPRYVDLLTGSPCSPRRAMERLASFKRHADRVAGAWSLQDIPLPKRKMAAAFLSGPRTRFTSADSTARRLVWASRPSLAARRLQANGSDRPAYIEDGFIRSAGLGSSFHPAASLALDLNGIYYDPESRSDLLAILAERQFDPDLLGQARDLRRAIVEHGLSKYHLKGTEPLLPGSASGRRILLVPGQVGNDASVLRGGGGMGNQALLKTVRELNPHAFIIYKPHPDVAAGNRPGHVLKDDLARWADLEAAGANILRCIAVADEIHTLTSLTGFEALLREKGVTTYGRPFYAGWGLTRDLASDLRVGRRRLTLDELVAAALILYPLYRDPVSGLPCEAADLVWRLGAGSAARLPGRLGVLTRYLRAAQHLVLARRPPAY